MVTESIYIVSAVILVYTYLGYPALMQVLSRFFGRTVRTADITPRVSVIITARNEERDIGAKLVNTLTLDYPNDRLEILVASDCSMDQTDAIVRGFADRGVILQRQSVRRGKTAAQNQAVQASSGDILVFTDATTMLSPQALKLIVRSFADPEVGCVGGQLDYSEPEDSGIGLGCRRYWNWEKRIRIWESRLGSLIGVSGCFYAVRRSCFRDLPGDMIDDFVVASEIHLQGLRTVYDSEALAMEYTQERVDEEFWMRVRVAEQSLNALRHYSKRLSRKWDLFRVQLISHKWLRYLAPCFLMAAYGSNLLLLAEGAFYAISFVAMTAFYVAAAIAWRMDRLGHHIGLLAVPYYFVLANCAAALALLKVARGDSRRVWEPVRNTVLESSNQEKLPCAESLDS
jgi:cellulose synthase/poly-beta-1,6-N-acetylglucosamine synthase-like glycosyltransferase